MTNWIGTRNPWNLAAPPPWWLRKLAARDAALRVFPGLTQPVYRIGRVTPRAKGLRPIAHDSETSRMVLHSCIPVTSLVPFVTWNDDFFIWLDEHDSWRLAPPERAGDAAADLLDARDRDRAVRQDAAEADALDQLSSSAWFGKQVRAGEVAFLSSGV